VFDGFRLHSVYVCGFGESIVFSVAIALLASSYPPVPNLAAS
jgi:hypothetical protein